MKTTIIVILSVIVAVAIIFFVLHFMKIIFKFHYGWRLKFPWYIISLITADQTKTLYALGFDIDGSIYRLKFYDYAEEKQVTDNINKIFNSANKHKNKQSLIAASHNTPSERIITYNPIESVPNWIYKLCNIKWI